jgi:hypothetical protein
MSVSRPKMRRVEVTASDSDVDGHIADAGGKSSSSISAGRRTFEPEM